MKTKFGFFILTFLCSFFLEAKQIGPESAKTIAKNAFALHFSKNVADVKVKTFTSRKFNGADFYHVVQFQQGGYVILSAEDVYEPILGISETSNIEPGNEESLDIVLASHLRNIHLAREMHVKPSERITKKWNDFKDIDLVSNRSSFNLNVVVPPLTTTQWSQSDAYNESCPVGVNSRGDANNFCGCVPIAVAQLIRYHEFPSRGTGTRFYTSTEGNEFIDEDFCDENYTWSNMPDILGETDINEDVTDFIFEVGASMETQYSGEYTGTFSEYIEEAMVYYWKYDRDLRVDYSYNPALGWNTNHVIDDLNQGLPCIYTGNKLDSDGFSTAGHAWVADGYAYGPNLNGAGSSSLYVHYNLGWRFGDSTGYYLDADNQWLLENNGGLDPTNFFSGFYFSRWLFWNIKPGSEANPANPSSEECQPPKPDFVNFQIGGNYVYVMYNNERPFNPRERFFLEYSIAGANDYVMAGDNTGSDGSLVHYVFLSGLVEGQKYDVRLSRECCVGDTRRYAYGSFTAGDSESGIMEVTIHEDEEEGGEGEGEGENEQCQDELLGHIFYDICDNQSYYLIRTDDGRVFDPYFPVIIEGGPQDGARIKFTYRENNIVACNDENIAGFQSAIDICTFEFIQNENDAFINEYPWVNNVCIPGATITLHSYIANDYWKYVLVNHNDEAGTYSLYLQNGSFYGTGTADGGVFELLSYYIEINNVLEIYFCPEER